MFIISSSICRCLHSYFICVYLTEFEGKCAAVSSSEDDCVICPSPTPLFVGCHDISCDSTVDAGKDTERTQRYETDYIEMSLAK